MRIPQRPRRPLCRVPGRRLPPGARRAGRRVLHPGRVERRPPAALVVLGQLKVVALPVHPDSDASDACPRIEPCAEHPESPIMRGTGKTGEAECRDEKSATFVDHLAKLQASRSHVNASIRGCRKPVLFSHLLVVNG